MKTAPNAPARVVNPSFTMRAAWGIRPVRLIICLGFLLVIAIATAGISAVSNLRNNTLADSGRQLQNVASALAEHAESMFEALALAQLGFVQQTEADKIASTEDFEQRMSGHDVHLLLKDGIRNLRSVHALMVSNSQGKVINSSHDWPIPSDYVADREYFETLNSYPTSPSHPGLSTHISAPIRDRATGNWVFHIAHKIVGSNGEFLGLVIGVMESRYFERLFENITLGPGSSVGLLRRDGRLLARYPEVDMLAAPSFSSGELFKDVLPKAGKGVVRLRSVFTGQDRFIAGQNLANHPAAVTVGIDIDVALADWRKGAAYVIGIAILMMLVVTAMVLLCAQQVGAYLNKQKFQLDTALNNMSQGLCVFDAAARIVICNERYLQMCGVPSEIAESGCTLRDILALRAEAGTFHGDLDEYVADTVREMAEGKPVDKIVERGGRTIAISNRPLAGGGWVSTHEDITELKQREQDLHLQNMKLDAALNNMSQGLCMFDAAHRFVVCNDRYARMYGLPPQLLEVGTPHAAIIRHRVLSGMLAGARSDDSADQKLRALNALPADAVSSRIDELSDGRLICVTRQPLAGGGWVALHEDITERRRMEQRIAYLAHHDALTDLPNRAAFTEQLTSTLDAAAKANENFALLCMDLDRFKEVNDVFGHSVGDGLLREVSRRLREAAGGAFLARLGGDEFTIIAAEGPQPATAEALAGRLLGTVADDLEIEGHRLRIGLSIGVAVYPTDGADTTTLLGNSDAALYRAKADGRGTIRFFEADMDKRLRERRALQHELSSALPKGELVLHYQPQAMIHGEIIGFEALVRWQHSSRGLIPPGTFIPLAEESGLILQMGEWILREACREAVSWPRPLQIAINLSPVQFRHGDLPGLVHAVLLETGLAPGRLELEITEGVLIGDYSRAASILRRLKALGVRIAMDDFGTGYSSLSYLQAFPFDKIKIDRAFIANLDRNPQSGAIIRAVIGLGHGLDLPVVAEGVETKDQLAFLVHEACNEVQGYLIGRPGPIADYAEMVGRERTVKPEVASRS